MERFRLQVAREVASAIRLSRATLVVSLGVTAVLLSREVVAQGRSEWRPPEGQQCGALPLPTRLPSVRDLLDSAVAVSILESDSAFSAGSALLAVGFDAAGALRQVRVLDADLPSEAARRLATVLAGLIDAQPAGGAGQLRLAVELGPQLRLSVARSEFCRLGIRPGQVTSTVERIGMVRAQSGEVTAMPASRSWQPLDVEVAGTSNRWLVTVDASGRALGATPLTGIAPPLLESTRAAVLKLRFNPALIDRVPVTMTDTVTVGAR